MEVVTLNSTNYIGLSANYSPDSLLKFNQNIYYTEQGVDLPLSQVLASANDSSTNNYSNLFLTQSTPLVSAAYIENLEYIPDDGFTTYLAVNAVDGITPTSNFLTTQEPPFSVATAAISMSGLYENLNNSYIFTVKFYNDDLCKIEHINDGIVRYLTISFDRSLYLTFDTGTDYLGDQSPQLFNYTYDRSGSYLILSKTLQDLPYYLSYDGISSLTAVPALTGVPSYPTNAIFTCIERPTDPNNTVLFDPWVSYQTNYKTNTQDINTEKSTHNINSNILLHSQYTTNSDGMIDFNALSLKNTNTPENYQSRNNPFQASKSQFLTEDDVSMREYKALFTGSNQTLGDDNITLGYESYTTDILLKGDTVTYFHVPQNLYPFTKLNINDSGLIQAGAIAGDHPVKADKIFKKLASAKNTSPFGAVTDETNGSFLCSWLSGATNITTQPVWVDRYYNPAKTTFISALTTQSLQAITYSTVFEGCVNAANMPSNTDEVFDVPSDLTFEPGAYYAYYHYGPSDVNKYIETFTPYIVEQGLPKYLYTDGSLVLTTQTPDTEYSFDGSKYAITESLSGIQESNQFTLCFDMYSQDWTKPFAHQIIGNLLNDGFGIFNENIITPTLFINSLTGLDVVNTDFTKLNTVNYPATALAFIRPRFTENYSVVFSDGYLRQYTCDDRLLRQTFSPYLSNTSSTSYTDTVAYILCPTATTNILLSADLISNTVVPVLTSIIDSNCYITTSSGSKAGYPKNPAGTVNYYKNKFYFTVGTLSRRVGNTIYYRRDNNATIAKWPSIGTSAPHITAFRANTATGTYFTDFNIDFDGNIWVINNVNNYYKFTQNNELLLSGTLTSNTPITTIIPITGNGVTTSFKTSATTLTDEAQFTVIVNNNKLRPTFDYSLSGNSIVCINPPLSGYRGTITYTEYLDTFNNVGVNFISEFSGSVYYTDVVFTRAGNALISAASGLSATPTPSYQFHTFDMMGAPLSSVLYTSPTGRPVLSNTDYLREYVQGTYPAANFNVKAIVSNVYNSTDLKTSEIIYNLSALDPGYHHFAVRFDSYHGFMTLFIDSQPVQTVQFEPRKYKFSNLIYRPFLVGSSNFNNSLPLFKYLKKNTYLAENIDIKNFYLYNAPLNDYDIIMHARKSGSMQDIHFDIPCGRRNYLEEIERYFKADLPGGKSTQYNVIIRNTGITDPKLQAVVEQRILKTLSSSAPAYSKLNTIKWVN